MFRSIEYKLIVWLVILVGACCGAVWLFTRGDVAWCVLSAMVALVALVRLTGVYRQYNSNIIFLLNALENGDFSFHFSTNKHSRRESEINRMLNRIKDILSAARMEVMENEKFLEIIVESAAAGIIIAEENGSIRAVNRSAARMLGLPVFTHLKQLRTIDPGYYDLIEGMVPGKSVQLKVANEREEQMISVALTVVGIRGKMLRIFSLTSIGSELEAREMESWIKLIRVMTHEIMNSIAPINSLSDTLMEAYRDTSGEPDPQLREDTVEAFRTINSTAKGLLSFVESYRRFTGVPAPQPVPVYMNDLVERILGLEAALFQGLGISVEIDLTGEGDRVMADPAQVGQVLVNLQKNAAEAVSNRPGASVRVSTVRQPGEFTVEVRNNGSPIPRDVESHIFVPFFTTKSAGTGIGLSLSRYIMRLHGGNLRYHRSGEWTVFSMVFPASPPTRAQEPLR